MSRQLESYGEDQHSIQQFGIEVLSKLGETLLANGAPGIHFYTMNQVEPNLAIWNNLKLDSR
jgi:methylenetetrahydrofolate reductase (NADPH)